MTNIDFASDDGRWVVERLHNEQVIWLTTVDGHGQPQSRPVWFVWDEDQFSIYSQAGTPKLTALAHNGKVSLNLNSSSDGSSVVTFEGQAQLVSEDSPGTNDPEFVAKYRRLIEGWEPDDFAASFCRLIRIAPTRMRNY